jgi:hypothetical protein
MIDLLKGVQVGKKGRPFTFLIKAYKAFKALKTMFTIALILAHFNLTKCILIKINALRFAIRAVIS